VNILALDTATGILSAALATGAGSWYAEADAGMRHSELLLEMADGLLKAADLGPGDLGGVLCMEGPGSFTGLRIGFAAAKALALARNIPWAAVPTLDCMAQPEASWPGLVLAAIDARKRSFFAALYRGDRRITDYLDVEPAVLAETLTAVLGEEGVPVLLTGPGGKLLGEELRPCLPEDLFPLLRLDPAGGRGRARELLEIGRRDLVLEKKAGGLYHGPLYLRKSDAEIKRPARELVHESVERV
jgi:tRNA threonylcarbamoyladenosine biosynthesis protein TsaB